MAHFYLQRAHCFRTRGSTGTQGHRGTEQAYSNALLHRVAWLLGLNSHKVTLALADDRQVKADLFLSVHQDGSSSTSAGGASVGYRDEAGRQFAMNLKAAYSYVGWPGGYRPDNYTSALHFYYGTGQALSVGTKVAAIMEAGFATNRSEDDWMWDNMDNTALAIANAALHTLGLPMLNTEKPDVKPPDVVHLPPPPLMPSKAESARCRVRLPATSRWTILNPASGNKAQIEAVQEFLEIPVTGQYGGDTEARVRELQSVVGLASTGRVNKPTWRAFRFLNSQRRKC